MNLEETLQRRGIVYEKHTHGATFTSQRLAEAEHVTGYQVAKPVVVRGAQGFAMCVLPAPAHLDLQRAAQALGESEVRLATEDEIAKLFPDCEVGAEPPMGTLYGLRTVMDEQLSADNYLVMQSGKHTEAIKLRREDWEWLCQPVVAAIARN